MSSIVFFITLVIILSLVLLSVNFIFAPHNPYKEKRTPFECGYHSFLAQNRTQFTISFFIFALLFLLFDLEIVMIYPLSVSSYQNQGYGYIIMILFVLVLALGFVFELGKNALSIYTKQNINILSYFTLKPYSFINSSLQSNILNNISLALCKAVLLKIYMIMSISILVIIAIHPILFLTDVEHTNESYILMHIYVNYITDVLYWMMITSDNSLINLTNNMLSYIDILQQKLVCNSTNCINKIQQFDFANVLQQHYYIVINKYNVSTDYAQNITRTIIIELIEQSGIIGPKAYMGPNDDNSCVEVADKLNANNITLMENNSNNGNTSTSTPRFEARGPVVGEEGCFNWRCNPQVPNHYHEEGSCVRCGQGQLQRNIEEGVKRMNEFNNSKKCLSYEDWKNKSAFELNMRIRYQFSYYHSSGLYNNVRHHFFNR